MSTLMLYLHGNHDACNMTTDNCAEDLVFKNSGQENCQFSLSNSLQTSILISNYIGAEPWSEDCWVVKLYHSNFE